MQLNESDIKKYCKNKPHITLTIATHEKGIDDIKSFGCDGVPTETESRSYEIGSVSKVFLSTFLAKCLEEGVLSLDDTIDQYIDLPAGFAYPTILQLATHTSGYVDPNLFDSTFKALSYALSSSKQQFNPFSRFGSDWLVDSVIEASRKPRKKEGRFHYANSGYAVLGHAISQALDNTYYDYMASYIENDLGLPSTSCHSEELPMIHGFGKDNDYGNWAWPDDSAYAPAGCICSDAVDMLSFAKMNLYDQKDYLTIRFPINTLT